MHKKEDKHSVLFFTYDIAIKTRIPIQEVVVEAEAEVVLSYTRQLCMRNGRH
jgi:hypothetical protein